MEQDDSSMLFSRMNLDNMVLPFQMVNGHWNALFTRFKLTKRKRVNALFLRWAYRKHWRSIDAMVVRNNDQLTLLSSYFPNFRFPIVVLDERHKACGNDLG